MINSPEQLIEKYGGISKYFFSKVFEKNSSQSQIFKSSIYPVITKILVQGRDALVFTYGVTNAGKTYTIIGHKENPGILTNSVNWLLDYKKYIQGHLEAP